MCVKYFTILYLCVIISKNNRSYGYVNKYLKKMSVLRK